MFYFAGLHQFTPHTLSSTVALFWKNNVSFLGCIAVAGFKQQNSEFKKQNTEYTNPEE